MKRFNNDGNDFDISLLNSVESGCRIIIDGHADVTRESKGNYSDYTKQTFIDNIGRKLRDLGKNTGSDKPMICVLTCHGGAAKPPRDEQGNTIKGIDFLSVGSQKYEVDGLPASKIEATAC